MTTTLIASAIALLIAGFVFHLWAAGVITLILMVGATWWADRRRRRRIR
jgi:hypothetical protein